MTEVSADKHKWNKHYRDGSCGLPGINSDTPLPSQVLLENSHLLPDSGTALDLACGLGANALHLAKQGLTTHAWDISDIAIDKLQQISQSLSLPVNPLVRDVVAEPPAKNSFNVIVVSRFLDRSLTASLIEAIKPGGLLFYQTFIVDKSPGTGPGNANYLLHTNELLTMFRSMTIRVYREEGLEGNTEQGFRNEAMLVAQKWHKRRFNT